MISNLVFHSEKRAQKSNHRKMNERQGSQKQTERQRRGRVREEKKTNVHHKFLPETMDNVNPLKNERRQ